MKTRKTSTQLINRRYIENEIMNFHDNKKYLDDVEKDIGVSASIIDETGIRGSETSDPTCRQVTNRLKSTRSLQRMQDNVNAIQYALDVYNADPEPRKVLLIKELYWFETGRKKGLTELALYFHIGERTLNRWRKAFISIVGIKLGMEI